MINGVNSINPLNNVQNLRKTESTASVADTGDTISLSPEAEKMAPNIQKWFDVLVSK